MSDDYSDSPSGPSFSDESAPQIANAALRISVTSRSTEAAAQIWQEIRRRIAKRGEFIVFLASGTDATVGVFHLAADELADDGAVRTAYEAISRAAAPLNFLICSLAKGDDQATRRLDQLLAELNKRHRFLKAPISKEAGRPTSAQDELLFQARGVANQLADDPPPLSSVALSEFAANEKEARREARAAKKTSKRDRDDVPAGSAKNSTREKPAKEKSQAIGSSGQVASEEPKDSRKKRKAEKRAALDPEPAAKEKKRDKAERRAAHDADRAKRKAEKLAAPGSDPQKPDRKDKSANKAERRARKAAAAESVLSAAEGAAREKRRKKDEALTEAEKRARKATRKEERKKQRQSGGEGEGDADSSRAVRISLKGFGEAAGGELRLALERQLEATPVEWPGSDKKADITIYGFDALPVAEIPAQATKIAEDTTKLRIFLGRHDAEGHGNRAIAALAGAFESPFIRLDEKLRRYGDGAVSTRDVTASSILGIAAGGRLSRHKLPRPMPPAPPDLVEARTLAAAPREFLEQLTWNDAKAPKLLWTHPSKDSAEALMNRKLVLPEEQTLDLSVPISWPSDVSGRSSTADIFGLEFLSGPLNYWYSKANGRDSAKVAEVDAVLKKHGATASQILAQSGAIIMDFVGKHPLSASAAWEENAVSRRSRVFALYLLCCKMAIKRKIKFDESICKEVILRLLELIEVLRSEDFYKPCSFDGVQQDCLVVGLGLVLRDTAYSRTLLQESLNRLMSCQLEPGLTADGVWRMGSFSDHCSLLAQFRTLLSDFDRNDVAMLEPVAAAAKKMTVFAEALQKSNGSAPSFDDSRDKSFARKLSGTRRALAGAGFAKSAPQRKVVPPRMTDTYVFRDAQYFVSHSTLKVVPESSLVILHADPASAARSDPGGVTVAFAYGASDLLVRAEPEAASRRDREAGFDPALRNGYHIDGTGFVSGAPLKANAARLEKSWRGAGWAGARSVDEINPAGTVARTVLHLKADHALIVVDELLAAGALYATFEQFWHIAPGLTPPVPGAAPCRFDMPDKGGMTFAFDPPANVIIEPEGEGSRIRHALRTRKGLAASLFQWSAEPGLLALDTKGHAGDWSVDVSGAGFAGTITLAAGELRYAPRTV